MTTVLLTDYAWPDTRIEQEILAAAGATLIAGPQVAGSAAEVEAMAQQHRPDAIMTCWAQVSARAIDLCPNLKVVTRLGVGLDNIDVDHATAKGVWVTNVPDYCIEEVSDHAIAMLLAWTRGIVGFDRQVKAGAWDPASARLRRLSELTVGVIGFGRTGRRTAAKLKPWGCRILALARGEAEAGDGVERVALDELLRLSDAVIVHVPLTAQTHHMIGAAALAQMKPGAFLINVSRGAVIDNAALELALAEGRIGGAGLDVLENEPTPSPGLTGQASAIITPHVAFSSDASLIDLRRRGAECVVSALRGDKPPMNACNRPRG